jgi:hypothetical protein
MIPLNSAIYDELETLDGLGYLDTYFTEIKPLSRVEAARLTREAERNIENSEHPDPLAFRMLGVLKEQLDEEVGWLVEDAENRQPTLLHPLQSTSSEYVYSSGSRRHWFTGQSGFINAQEGTPLLPNNDGLQTDPGSNEVIRASGWAGFGGFLTGYAEGAFAGPLDHNISGTSRGQLLGAEAVVSWGNSAISFGQQERWWGTGHYGSLAQGDNAKPFYALTLQSIHPFQLPGFLRYLGPGRTQIFLGQLDADRSRSQHPWIGGQTVVFKPLPQMEFGLTREIIFGGQGNDHYGWSGFLGRYTGFATGSPSTGNTKSHAGVFIKFHFPRWRDLQVYQELNGSDNLTDEIPIIGGAMPFRNVSYQGGFYLPRITEDGLTDCHFEYTITSGGYNIQQHNSLYSTYNGELTGDPMGPNASQVDLQFGRWVDLRYKASLDLFYTEQAPSAYEGNVRLFYAANSAFYPYGPLKHERSGGMAFDLQRLAERLRIGDGHALVDGEARVAFEYVDRLNYGEPSSFRTLVTVSVGLTPLWQSLRLTRE